MIIFDGKYGWSGKKLSKRNPISWWAGAYWLKIMDLSKSNPNVVMLKPIIVIVSDTGEGASATNCAPDLVKSVCHDFELDVKKVLWMEYHPGDAPYLDVAQFIPMAELHDETLYSVSWRSIHPNELEMIIPFFPEAGHIQPKSPSTE